MSKLLFILKHRDALYSDENYSYGGLSSGLLNSATFVVDMLNASGIEAKLVQVADNNCIDREVSQFQPTHVVIEAYWVVPDKFRILHSLHPNVKWIIRNHSETAFLATEGIALDWTMKYLSMPNVYVGCNSPRALREMKTLAIAQHGPDATHKVMYLPNYYIFRKETVQHPKDDNVIDIGLFGAIRPLKNQLIQAIAAIEFAQKIGKKLRLHINATRVENGGNNPLKNIQGIFDNLGPDSDYQLIEHSWMCHDKFLDLCSLMDMLLCVSFTETFCIVAADGVSMGIPLVTSPEVVWASGFSQADPTSSEDIVAKMSLAWHMRKLGILQKINELRLQSNVEKARDQWTQLFNN